MNQKTPMQTPPRSPQHRPPQRGPEQKNDGLFPRMGRIFPILLAVALAVLVISIALLCVALAVGKDKPDPVDDPKQNEAGADEGDGEGEDAPQKPTGANKGGVATTPSRDNYAIENSADYAKLTGLQSKYAILVELDSYKAIAGINTDTKICPASMTKVMTLLVACENLGSLKEKVSMSANAVKYQLEHDGSGLDWKGGEEVTVEDLLYLVFLRSDTVASITLAEYVAGSEAAFVDMMNAKAKDLGLENTRFSNSTGLYFAGDSYYSTCRDMAVIMAYALDNSLAKKVMTQTGTWYLPKSAPVENIKATWLTDRFGGDPSLDTVTVKAAKTGWETEPGACLVSYAQSNGGGKEYIMVIVGGNGLSAKSSTIDVKGIYKDFAD